VSVITLESTFRHLDSNSLVDAQDNHITNLSHQHHVSKAQTAAPLVDTTAGGRKRRQFVRSRWTIPKDSTSLWLMYYGPALAIADLQQARLDAWCLPNVLGRSTSRHA